jgi:hypothetical protein
MANRSYVRGGMSPARWRVEIFHEYDKEWVHYGDWLTRDDARDSLINARAIIQIDPQGYTKARLVDLKGK